jgi:hypothetical protein
MHKSDLTSHAGKASTGVSDDPTCEKCKQPITTGFMAAFCKYDEKCALHPGSESAESVTFFRNLFRPEEPKSIGAAYLTDKEIIVLGIPTDGHDCDAMGCGMSHVVFRQRRTA